MVDASVGGKTAVNSQAGKNLVGAFYQPRGVWVDVEVLRTLPLEEARCGWGEVIKHAFLESEDAVGWLEGLAPALLAGDRGVLEEVVRRSCAFKASVVEEDERETGRRAILNLGHTVGHAIEKVAGYGAMGHGQAVGIGMVAEARFGVAKGWVEPEVPVRMAALLQRFGLPIRAANLSLEALQMAVIVDKKVRRGTLVLPLVAAVGEVCLREVPLVSLKQALVLALEETA
jgi:3-dehydroquinate synthase